MKKEDIKSDNVEISYGYSDLRLEKRLVKIVNSLKESDLTQSFPKIFSKYPLKAFYSLMEHPQTNHHDLTQYFCRKNLSTIGNESCYYLIQDTTEISLDKFVKGAGVLGEGTGNGVYLHNGLLVNMQGLPISLVHQFVINREKKDFGKAQLRKQKSFESKESFKWAAGLIAGYELCQTKNIQLIHIMDREGDCVDVFNYAQEYQQSLIVRSVHDRKIENSETINKLWDVSNYENYIFCYRELPDAKKQKKQVKCRISWQKVELKGADAPLYAVHIQSIEVDFDVSWLLLTNKEVIDEQMALFIVDSYVFRWLIEEFHKCLKSGCKVEERRFDDIETYMNCGSLLSQNALNLLKIKALSIAEPETEMKTNLSQEEINLLDKLAAKYLRPKDKSNLIPFTNIWFITIIATMGGFLSGKNRKPGWSILWCGYQKYLKILEGFLIASNLSVETNSA